MESARVASHVGCDVLTLVFLGWGTDSNALRGFGMEGRNVVALWDYRRLVLPELSLGQWGRVDVVGWSMGVWAAEECMAAMPDVRWGTTVALCGSPRPVDDLYGIPTALVQATLDGWNERNRRKFNLRMYGGASAMESLAQTVSLRPVDEQKEELREIVSAQSETHPGLTWSKAYVGEDDMIFGKENLGRYWGEGHAERVVVCPMPHFPFGYLNSIDSLLEL